MLVSATNSCYFFEIICPSAGSVDEPRIPATNPGYESTPKARTTTILVHSKLNFTHRRLKTVLLIESKKCEECFAQNEEISYPMDERKTIVLEKRLHAAVPDRAVLFCQSKMSNM